MIIILFAGNKIKNSLNFSKWFAIQELICIQFIYYNNLMNKYTLYF